MGSMFSELVASEDAMRLTKKLMDVNFIGTVGPLAATLPSLLKAEDGVVRRRIMSDTASYYTRYIPFIHLYCRIYTYVHPLYMYIHHMYTMYTPNTPLNPL